MQDIPLSLIVAMASNRVIGRDNQLPWRLPKDLAYFKKMTMGLPLVMGRKTFESIGRPLPGRTSIVVTRQANWQHPGVLSASSVPDALAVARQVAQETGAEQVMLMGGATVYEQALEYCDRLYITEVHADYSGDAYFPELPDSYWLEVSRKHCAGDAEEGIPDCSFVVYERK